MDAFLGEIRAFPYTYVPQGWVECDGSLVPISVQTALFALIGTTYGGNGTTTFALPDLRGRTVVQCGDGPMGNLAWGEEGDGAGASAIGSATLSMTAAGMPEHGHGASFTPGPVAPPVQPTIAFHASTDPATNNSAPAGGFLSAQPASAGAPSNIYSATAAGSVTLSEVTATASGGSGSITGGTVEVANAGTGTAVGPVKAEVPARMPPFVAIRYAICVNGIFPQRP